MELWWTIKKLLRIVNYDAEKSLWSHLNAWMGADERLAKRFHSRSAVSAQFASLVNFSFHRCRLARDASAIMNVFVVLSSWKICKTRLPTPASRNHTQMYKVNTKLHTISYNGSQSVLGWERNIYFIADAVNKDSSWMGMKRVEIVFLPSEKIEFTFLSCFGSAATVG